MTTFINPYTYISDPTRGRPVFNGRLFFGNPDTDPTQPENQVTVSLVNENGTLTALMQPIATGPGGVALVNGSPAQLDITLTQYSLTIQNGLGVQVYYSPRVNVGAAGGPDPTDLLNQFSQVGTPRFITAANNNGNPFPYQTGARVVYNPGTGDRIYESLTSNNTTLPTDTDNWQEIGAAATDTRNDARYLVEANNLSDLDSVTTTRTNLGLGTAATRNVGTATGNIAQIGTPGTTSAGANSAVVTRAGSNANGAYRMWSDGFIDSVGRNTSGTFGDRQFTTLPCL